MAFEKVMGQEHVARLFRGVLRTGRLAHAYLFLGPRGVGKALFAKELAKAVLCHNPQPDACDACDACRKFEHGRHADFHLVRPAEGKRFVSIDDIKGLQDAIAVKPVERGYKVFVIDDADAMTVQAANAFLKTLEEPPRQSLLILVAASVEPMLDTIVSRCQLVRFRPLGPEVIARALVEQHDVAEQDAAAVANFAGGSLGRACAMLESQADESRRWISQAAASLDLSNAMSSAEELLGRARQAGGSREDTRTNLRQALSFLMLQYRDQLMRRQPAPPKTIFDHAQLAPDSPLAQWSEFRLERAISRVLDAIAQIDMNANEALVVETLFMDLARGPAMRVIRDP